MTKLSNYASKAPEFMKLSEGNHEVRLVSYKETDSFHNYDGSLKDELPEYSNPCEQLAITLVAITGGGGLTHRMNLEGYVKFSELTTKEIQSGKFSDVAGYACAINQKSKKLERIIDENKTKTCEGILDQFFASTGLPEGSGVNDLDTAIAEKMPLSITVVNDPFEGKDQLRIKSFRKIKADVDKKVTIE
jgi:hypothetical protein